VGSDYGKEVVLFQKVASCAVREKVRTSSNMIVNEVLVSLLLAKLLQRVGPENVTHKTMCRWFPETIDLF
jgi:hypothetical protein